MNTENTMEMPKYKCHKEVWALKIDSVEKRESGSALITPHDKRYAPFIVSPSYMKKHKPVAGGYYVAYKGGYKSYSPADVFEDGYTLV